MTGSKVTKNEHIKIKHLKH